MIAGLGHVNRVGVEERTARLAKRSIKTTAKQQGICLAVSTLDLTTLEGADTSGKIRHVCGGRVPASASPRRCSRWREGRSRDGMRTASVT